MFRKYFLTLFLIVFALGFGAMGAGMIYSAYIKETTYSAAAEGRIIDYNDASYSSEHKYSPIVEYQVGNQVLIGETNVSFNYRPFKTGETVLVYYNPGKPDEFYIREYDLRTTYGIGGIFLFVCIGIFVLLALRTILNKAKISKEKKEQMKIRMIISAILLFMFTVFSFVAGLGKTICIFAAMGFFILYGMRQDRRKKRNDSMKP